jgi:hypothetical protein
MLSYPEGFQCKQCDRCCKVYIQVTEEDMLRWAVEFRDDILQRVSTHDLFIRPVAWGGSMRCPFLRKLSNKGIYICVFTTRDLKPAPSFPSPGNKQNV